MRPFPRLETEQKSYASFGFYFILSPKSKYNRMDIFIIYVIKTLLLPLSSLLLLNIIGLFLLQRQRTFAVILISFSLGLLLLLSLPVVTKYLAATQEIYPPINNNAAHKFSA